MRNTIYMWHSNEHLGLYTALVDTYSKGNSQPITICYQRIPYQPSNLSRSNLWSILTKAADRSSSIRTITIPLVMNEWMKNFVRFYFEYPTSKCWQESSLSQMKGYIRRLEWIVEPKPVYMSHNLISSH